MGLGDFKNDLAIRIGAIFNGAGAFKNASNAVTKLDKSVKFLAKSYAGLFVVQKAVAFGKSSLTEYGRNQTAIAKLTAEVTNLGQAFELTSITKYLDTLEKTFAVQKEELRPAFQELMRVTKSYAVSQDLLRTGLDVSAGSGQSLATVINDLNQAYVGNQKGLKKYNLGLTNAELATMSFQEVTALLATTFSGQAAKASTSFEKSMVKLDIAAGHVKDQIGKGLVQALINTGGEGATIDDLTRRMESFGTAVGNAVSKVGDLVSPFVRAYEAYAKLSKKMRDDTSGRTEAARRTQAFVYGSGNMPDLPAQALKDIKKRQQLEKESLARQKQIAALAKKQTAEEKAKLLLLKAQKTLDTASKIFDMDLIQNTAALMGKVTADEALRLKLQQAILNENADAAAGLSQQLLSSQLAAMKLSSTNPLSGWGKYFSDALEALRQLRDELAKLGAPKVAVPSMPASLAATTKSYTTVNGITVPSDFGGAGPVANIVGGGQRFVSNNPNAAVNELRITIDPTAAQYGIGVASVNNSANGNSNNYSTRQSFAGGL
jgi:hypothetical protein